MISEVSDMKVHPVRGFEGATGDVSTNAFSGLTVVTVDPEEYLSGHAVTVPGRASRAPLVRAYLRGSVGRLPTEDAEPGEMQRHAQSTTAHRARQQAEA